LPKARTNSASCLKAPNPAEAWEIAPKCLFLVESRKDKNGLMGSPRKLTPDPTASGNHTTFMENLLGMITKYATWVVNAMNPSGFDEQKRVDLDGDEHFNKATGKYIHSPHVHDRDTPGRIREASLDEIPKRSVKNQRKYE
jgi:hypothetical protein